MVLCNQEIGAAFYLSMISNFIDRPIKAKAVVLGSMTVNGNLIKTTNLYEKLSFIVEQGAKTVYIPISNQPDTMTMQPDIWSKLSILFYASAEDLSKKCLIWNKLNSVFVGHLFDTFDH